MKARKTFHAAEGSPGIDGTSKESKRMPESHRELSERVEALEISLAHQQRLVEQLNEVVTDQAKQLMQFERIVPALQQELRDLKRQMSDTGPSIPNEKPPHY